MPPPDEALIERFATLLRATMLAAGVAPDDVVLWTFVALEGLAVWSGRVAQLDHQ